jgi:hypothetical protein
MRYHIECDEQERNDRKVKSAYSLGMPGLATQG